MAIKERIAALVGLVIKKTMPSGGTGRSNWNSKGGQVDYSGKKMTPGMIMELGAGDDVEVVDPKGAATVHGVFPVLALFCLEVLESLLTALQGDLVRAGLLCGGPQRGGHRRHRVPENPTGPNWSGPGPFL